MLSYLTVIATVVLSVLAVAKAKFDPTSTLLLCIVTLLVGIFLQLKSDSERYWEEGEDDEGDKEDAEGEGAE